MQNRLFGVLAGALLLLASCGGGAAPVPSSPAASAATAAKPSGASAGAASAKPAVAASSSAKPAAAASLSAKPAASGAVQLKSVSFGLVGKNATEWPLYVGDAEGLFRDQGIKLDIAVTSASASTAQQLTAKAIDLGTSGIVDFIRAINSGAGITIANSSVAQPLYTMLAQKNIKTWADLKGKTVSIGGPKDITFIRLVGGGVMTGADTGLGPESVIGRGSVANTT